MQGVLYTTTGRRMPASRAEKGPDIRVRAKPIILDGLSGRRLKPMAAGQATTERDRHTHADGAAPPPTSDDAAMPVQRSPLLPMNSLQPQMGQIWRSPASARW